MFGSVFWQCGCRRLLSAHPTGANIRRRRAIMLLSPDAAIRIVVVDDEGATAILGPIHINSIADQRINGE
jgi:hypothetical protein